MSTETLRRTDEEIERDVVLELRWDASLRPNDIAVAVRNGVVTLAGWVDSYQKRQAAERAVHRVRGVRAVANDIEVRLPAEGRRPDSEIAAAAVRALEWDSVVPDEQIQLTVTDGWVTLRGEVEWQYQRHAAERAVRNLAGIRGVTNLITVSPGSRQTAQQLRKQIEAALVRSARRTPRTSTWQPTTA